MEHGIDKLFCEKDCYESLWNCILEIYYTTLFSQNTNMWEVGGGGVSWCPPFWKEDTQQQQPRAGSENTFKRQRRKVGDSGDPQKSPDFAERIIILWQLPTPSKPEPQPEFWSEVKPHSHLQGSRKERNENLTWEGGASSSPRGAPLTSSAATQDTWGQTLSRGGGGTGWGGCARGRKAPWRGAVCFLLFFLFSWDQWFPLLVVFFFTTLSQVSRALTLPPTGRQSTVF